LRRGFLRKARSEARSLSFMDLAALTTKSLRKKTKQTLRFYCMVTAKQYESFSIGGLYV